MNLNTDRISLYRKAMEIEARRDSLVTELAKLDLELNEISKQLFGSQVAKSPSGPPQIDPALKPERGPRKSGKLGPQILEILETAGERGVRAVDVAKQLGVNPPNIYVWFATTGKKNKAIKKLGPGRYRMN